jgi:hypothetical protein
MRDNNELKTKMINSQEIVLFVSVAELHRPPLQSVALEHNCKGKDMRSRRRCMMGHISMKSVSISRASGCGLNGTSSLKKLTQGQGKRKHVMQKLEQIKQIITSQAVHNLRSLELDSVVTG